VFAPLLADRDVEGLHDAVLAHRLDVDDLTTVVDKVRHPPRRPFQVVVELDAQREERLVVHEVDEPPLLVQESDEAVRARRIAHRDEVLEERDLHRGVVDQHPAVPAEAVLLLDERGVDRSDRLGRVVVLVDGDRQREVRRPEADAEDVVHASCASPMTERVGGHRPCSGSGWRAACRSSSR